MLNNILIVDDDPISQCYLKSILEQCGIRSESSGDGLDAIKKIRSSTYDLIFMDFQMPKLDGFETLTYIRHELIMEVPVIMMSGDEKQHLEMTNTLQNLDIRILTKPFSREVIILLLKEIMLNQAEKSMGNT